MKNIKINQLICKPSIGCFEYYRVVKKTNGELEVVTIQKLKWIKEKTEIFPVEDKYNDKATRTVDLMKLVDDTSCRRRHLDTWNMFNYHGYQFLDIEYDNILQYKHLESDVALPFTFGNSQGNNIKNDHFTCFINKYQNFLFIR